MELCNSCQSANNLPACVDIVTIGVVTANSDVYIYVQDITVGGNPKRFAANSDEDGYVDWILGNFEPMPKHSYKIWVTLQSARNNQCFEPIYPADCEYAYVNESYDCFSVHFEYIEDDDMAKVYYTNATLTIAE